MNNSFLEAAAEIGAILGQHNIPYQFTGAAALKLQGVELEDTPAVEASVQWDIFHETHSLFAQYSPSEISRDPEMGEFSFSIHGVPAVIRCFYNTTIKTDPYRIQVRAVDEELWCSSLYTHLYEPEMKPYESAIHDTLRKKQNELTSQNEKAWNQDNYAALVNRYGKPEAMAGKIKDNPKWRLHPFYKYMGSVEGKRIAHLMGSNGVKGTALALLGADVTVVDFSKENAAFAQELAAAAGVPLQYYVSDVLSIPDTPEFTGYDMVVMELGVLHYYMDLVPLFEIVKRLLKQGGQFILHEFHPISTKLITSKGKKHKVTGNYFDPVIEENTVAFSKHLSEEQQKELAKVAQRKWTIGELVTALGRTGLVIKVLEEQPNHKMDDVGLPKTYTLVAEK